MVNFLKRLNFIVFQVAIIWNVVLNGWKAEEKKAQRIKAAKGQREEKSKGIRQKGKGGGKDKSGGKGTKGQRRKRREEVPKISNFKLRKFSSIPKIGAKPKPTFSESFTMRNNLTSIGFLGNEISFLSSLNRQSVFICFDNSHKLF